MGYKLSMIIIEDMNKFRDESLLLRNLGFNNAELIDKTSFEECLYPNDNTINIGYANGNIIICDDYYFTNKILELKQPKYENLISNLFPDAEILTIACHSGVNYHAYSLCKNENKIRYKIISFDSEKVEFGELMKEEVEIYSKAVKTGKKFIWKESDEEYTEDQLMEDFTFEIIKRRLGARLDMQESDELQSLEFNKYKVASIEFQSSKKSGKIDNTNLFSRVFFSDKWYFRFFRIFIIIVVYMLIRHYSKN